MSSILHEDTFHGTKKGGRRKTVSKRRAYVNTPSQIIKRLKVIIQTHENSWNSNLTERALRKLITDIERQTV